MSTSDNQVLDEVRALATEVRTLSGTVNGLTTDMQALSGTVNGLTTEVRTLSGTVTSLNRQVGRMDQRLIDVEGHVVAMKRHTDLIPGIAEAVPSLASDIDNHEKWLKHPWSQRPPKLF